MRTLKLAALLLVVGGCSASARPSALPPATSPPLCKAVDTTIPPRITSYVEGGIKVHTFLAPELSASTATHVIEGNEALIVVDTQMFRRSDEAGMA